MLLFIPPVEDERGDRKTCYCTIQRDHGVAVDGGGEVPGQPGARRGGFLAKGGEGG